MDADYEALEIQSWLPGSLVFSFQGYIIVLSKSNFKHSGLLLHEINKELIIWNASCPDQILNARYLPTSMSISSQRGCHCCISLMKIDPAIPGYTRRRYFGTLMKRTIIFSRRWHLENMIWLIYSLTECTIRQWRGVSNPYRTYKRISPGLLLLILFTRPK